MSEIEDLRRRRIEELRAQMAEQQQEDLQEHLQLQQQIEAIEQLAKQHLSRDAISRYGNLKAAHPEKAIRIAVMIAQAVQAGQIKTAITDDQFKELLRQLQPPKRDFKVVKK